MSVVLKADVREKAGIKGHVRSLRQKGMVPGVVYGADKEPEPLAFCHKLLLKAISGFGFMSKPHTLEKEAGTPETVLVKDIQFHPVKDTIVHIDLWRLKKGSRVTIMVPISFVHQEESPGLKRGGILNTVVHALEVSTTADLIPESFTISLKDRQLNEAIHLSDLVIPEGVKVLKLKPESTLANIIPPSGLADEEADQKDDSAEETSSS